jgi:hypothetical protein
VTADRRLRIGGWAALLVAIVSPLRVVVLFLQAHEPDPFSTSAYVVVETVGLLALLVAVIFLDRLYRPIAQELAPIALAIGAVGAALAAASDLAGLAGIRDDIINTILFVVCNVLIGVWFLIGGVILMSEGGALARIGWTAELGGLGTILTALALAVGFGGPLGTGSSFIDWFLLLSLFVVIYLVRIWRYVVGGQLPGPGIL